MSSDVTGPTIQLASGRYFDLADPRAADVHLRDIAHALAQLCRFTGHTRWFYSVAQHSCLCHDNADASSQWEALMHDAAEAYIGDVSRPLKTLLPDYGIVEMAVEHAVAVALSLPWPMPRAVDYVDREALATERRDLMPATGEPWPIIDGVVPWSSPIEQWSPARACDEFMARVRIHRPDLDRP